MAAQERHDSENSRISGEMVQVLLIEALEPWSPVEEDWGIFYRIGLGQCIQRAKSQFAASVGREEVKDLCEECEEGCDEQDHHYDGVNQAAPQWYPDIETLRTVRKRLVCRCGKESGFES